MLSIIGSILGFGTSIIPKVMGYFETKRDQQFELKCMEKQHEINLALGNQKMQMVNIDADIRETESLHKEHAEITKKASQFWINVSSSVRPMTTYILLIEFMTLTYLLAFDLIDIEMYSMIWNEPMQSVWAAVVCFWFGQRTFNRK
tara:strand:+ start:333 stop:770 length:438 start_codon:yes stop_codon:yes gene_type:complete